MELVGQGPQGLAQKGDGGGPEGLFPGAGGEQLTLRAHKVPHVEGRLEKLVGLPAHLVPLDADLDAAPDVPQGNEGEPAHAPQQQDPARHPHAGRAVGQGGGLRQGVGGLEALRVGVGVGPDGLQLLNAHFAQRLFAHDKSFLSNGVFEVRTAF